jgi:hypothetical protein
MASALPDGPLKDEVARLSGIRALLLVGKCRRLVHLIDLRNTDRNIVVCIGVDRAADGGAAPPYERHPEPRHSAAVAGFVVAPSRIPGGGRCRWP